MNRFFYLIASTLVLTTAAQAQGIIIGPDARPVALELRAHRIDAEVQEQVAVVTVEHVFFNPSQAIVEGTFLFPLPPGAQVSQFSMEVDGKEMHGELLSAEEARRIYEDIVRRSLDPALLEMADYRTFRASVFPIPGGATRTVTLRYDATLPKEGNTVSFRYPLQGALSTRGAFMPQPMPEPRPGPGRRIAPEHAPRPEPLRTESEITIRVDAARGIRNVYSPSHEVDVDRPNDRRAVVEYASDEGLTGRDFLLYYSIDPGEVGASLLAHRPYSDEPGYFMVLLSPQVEFAADRLQGQDVVFVLDTSGSMAEEKMEQAREALRYVLNRLTDRDRFGVVAFSTEAEAFRPELVTTAMRDDALYFVDRLDATGGTNINDALLQAAELLEESERGVIVFLTDGLPSVGVQDEGAIRRNVEQATDGRIRIFSFGVGYDVNTLLLDGLSREADAFADYISPEENIEERVSTFYEKIRHPVLTDLAFTLEGADAYAFAPRDLPDLYKGGQLILAGRYREPGQARLVLTGRMGDDPQRLVYSFDLPARERDQDFVARLWATRRVGQLLDEIRLHGENEELKDEVVALATTFGLVTPYTSYLVQEEELAAGGAPVPPPMRRGTWDRVANYSVAPEAADAALQQSTGAGAVQMSKSIREMQEARAVPADGSAGVVNVLGRLLRQEEGGAWVDAAFDAAKDTPVPIRFASDPYFTLLRLYPELREAAALGDRVTFRFKDRWVQIGTEGKDLDEAGLRKLFGDA